MLWSQRVTKLTVWCAVVATALLSGCVALPPAPKANASLLLSVVMKGDQPLQQPPAALIVTLDDLSVGTMRQFVYEATLGTPGYRAEFAVRMEVPAGRHRVSRLVGAEADGAAIPGLDYAFAIDVEAREGATDYLGHLEVSSLAAESKSGAETARLVIVDAYEDDLPDLVHAWPELRKRRIERRAPQDITMVPLASRRELEEHADAGAPPLDVTAVNHLPRRSQLAFDSFLKSKYPRAFAVGLSGATGVAAGGTNVIQRALRDCQRAQGRRRQPCKLFALDDTLMEWLEGSSGAIGGPQKK